MMKNRIKLNKFTTFFAYPALWNTYFFRWHNLEYQISGSSYCSTSLIVSAVDKERQTKLWGISLFWLNDSVHATIHNTPENELNTHISIHKPYVAIKISASLLSSYAVSRTSPTCMLSFWWAAITTVVGNKIVINNKIYILLSDVSEETIFRRRCGMKGRREKLLMR